MLTLNRMEIYQDSPVPDPDREIWGGGHGHPDPEIRGGGGGEGAVSKKFFSALWALVFSKNKGDGRLGPLPWIRHCSLKDKSK